MTNAPNLDAPNFDAPLPSLTIPCPDCGTGIARQDSHCPHCGLASPAVRPVSHRTFLRTALLCLLLGAFGAHRFYVGRPYSGVAMLLTLGGCGLWALNDMIHILNGNFLDGQNRPLQR